MTIVMEICAYSTYIFVVESCLMQRNISVCEIPHTENIAMETILKRWLTKLLDSFRGLQISERAK